MSEILQKANYETERRFLIKIPEAAYLENASLSRIVQTYLLNEQGATERVRSRSTGGKSVYTHTLKRRISAITRLEDEREIDLQEYEALLKRADPARRSIEKRRYCLEYGAHVLEIDVFPFWEDRAILEIELSSEAEEFSLPDFISVYREISTDKRYTNAALALSVPMERL